MDSFTAALQTVGLPLPAVFAALAVGAALFLLIVLPRVLASRRAAGPRCGA